MADASPSRAHPARLAELVDTLALMPDRLGRIDLLIDVADRFRDVPQRIARRQKLMGNPPSVPPPSRREASGPSPKGGSQKGVSR